MSALRRLTLTSTTRQAWRWTLQQHVTRQPQARHPMLLPPAATPSHHATAIRKREIHFLPLLGLWGAKHLSMWTLYNTAKAYGWPRVYRRLLEQNRAMFARGYGTEQHQQQQQQQQQQQMQSLLRLAIRSPTQLARQLSDQANTVLPYLQALAERAEPAVPQFLVVAAKVMLQSAKPIKLLQDVLSAVPSSAKKGPK